MNDFAVSLATRAVLVADGRRRSVRTEPATREIPTTAKG
jgi:hypothetical protein